MKMAEYLSPNYEQLSLNDQRYIFAIRNRMIEIEHNFRKQLPEENCICGEQITQHTFTHAKIMIKILNTCHIKEFFKKM